MSKSRTVVLTLAALALSANAIAASDGFEFVGGEAGWQPAVAKYEFRAGKLVHAADCTMNLVAAPQWPAGDALIEHSPGA